MTDYTKFIKEARAKTDACDQIEAFNWMETLADAVESLVSENEKLRDRLSWTEQQEAGLRDDLANLEAERDALRAQLDNVANVIERIVDVANFSAIEGDDGFIWRYDMPPGPIHAAIKKLNELGHPVASIGRVRLNPDTRADLIEFARTRIQMVWDDAGAVDAQTLAENVVSAQEWLWLSLHFPVEVSE